MSPPARALSKKDRLIIAGLVFFCVFNLTMDLYLILHSQVLAERASTSWFAYLWAVYSDIDRGWILGFIATLFAIHVGRMGFDRTFLGVMSPGFATLGDLAIALLLAFVVVIPCGVDVELPRAPASTGWTPPTTGRLEAAAVALALFAPVLALIGLLQVVLSALA